jgi:hypothetical protein
MIINLRQNKCLLFLIINSKAILISIKDQTLPLIKTPYVIYFAGCCALQFGTFCIGGGLNLFLPDIFNELSIARQETSLDYRVCDVANMKRNLTVVEDPSEVCDDTVSPTVFTNIFILGVVYIVGFIVLSLVLTPERRRTIMGKQKYI